jgi:hypothetical protein
MNTAMRFAFGLQMIALGLVSVSFVVCFIALVTTGSFDIGLAIMSMLTMVTFNGLAELVKAFVIAKLQFDKDDE